MSDDEDLRRELTRVQERLSGCESRLSRLHAFAADLSAASSIAEVARVVLGAGVGALGADIAGVWKVDGPVATLVAESASDPSLNGISSIALNVPAPLTLAVQRAEPVFIQTRAEYAALFPVTEAMTRDLSIRAKANACLPLSSNGAVIAVMVLGFRDERMFDEIEREFLILLAHHASIAFQRAMHLQAELENSRRLRKLHEATDALTSARTPVEVAEATVNHGAEAIGALSGALWLEQPDGTLLMQAHHNVPASEMSLWERVPVDADLPLCRVLRTGRIVWVSNEDDYAREAPEAIENVRAENRGWGYVAIPLSDGKKGVGVLSFSYAGTHGFAEDERRFLQALARTCEHSLDRARLFVSLSEANANKDAFLAMLGHELRNPLAAMVAAMDFIKLKTPDLDRQHSVLDRQLAHLVHMVADLIDVARITRGQIKLQRQAVDVAGAVEYAVDTSRALIDKLGHTVHVEVPPDVLVDADRERLGQVLANLVNNAVKYTPPGGRIEIAASRVGEFVEIHVRDSGIGITPTLMPHLFDMFVQGERAADRAEGGLGVGLTAVRTLVELHGGSISARSAGQGAGSTFTVRWPRAGSQTPTTKMPAISLNEARRLRVLIVDPNRAAAEALAHVMDLMGHEVIIEHDGDRAVRAAESGPLHVALVDVSGTIDGYGLAEQLRMRSKGQAMSLIAITREGHPHDEPRAQRAGFSRSVSKPFDADTLSTLMNELSSLE